MITFSVGEKQPNVRQDVLLVQTLLKTKGYDPGPIDGICGTRTIRTIRQFQASFLKQPDGVIEPNRQTWIRLASTNGASKKPVLSEWHGDSTQWSQEKKIRSLTPTLRPKVIAVVNALKQRGFSPTIRYGWRSVATQLQLYRLGNTKVEFSFHNVQKSDGTPNAHAADIIDSRFGWSEQAATAGFWKALGEEAKKQGLYWGGDWPDFRDWAHVQLLPNSDLAKVKRESGL